MARELRVSGSLAEPFTSLICKICAFDARQRIIETVSGCMARHFTNRSIKMTELPEHVRHNRAHWDQLAPQFVSAGEHGWAINEPNWGIWSVPESEVHMFPEPWPERGTKPRNPHSILAACIKASREAVASRLTRCRSHSATCPLICAAVQWFARARSLACRRGRSLCRPTSRH